MSDHLTGWLRAQLDVDVHVAQRDFAAKREILAKHYPIEQRGLWHKETGYDTEIVCATCVDVYDDEDYGGHMRQFRDHVEWPCEVAKALAARYADRPGYEATWQS